MKTKSRNIGFIGHLRGLFLLGGLFAGMTLAASATQFFHINGNPASINSADGDLADGSVDYLWSTNPPTKTGLVQQSLTTMPIR